MVSRVGIGKPNGRFRLPAPCEVLEADRQPAAPAGARSVMHYRASPGHMFEGDEQFAVRLDGQGQVWLEVDVTSRPVWFLARLAGPVTPIGQRLFVLRCAQVLRRAPISAGASG
jgi:uncharacterized protein (UPF0548 family)